MLVLPKDLSKISKNKKRIKELEKDIEEKSEKLKSLGGPEDKKSWDTMLKDKESDVYSYLNQSTQDNIYEAYKRKKNDNSITREQAKEYFKSMMPFAIKAFQCAVVGPTIEVDGHYLGEYIYSFDIEKAKKFPSPRTRLASNYSIEGFVAAYCLALKYYDINSILTRSASQK